MSDEPTVARLMLRQARHSLDRAEAWLHKAREDACVAGLLDRQFFIAVAEARDATTSAIAALERIAL